MPLSEVARLLQQIELECEAAQRGLTGLATGTAQHAFIDAKMRHIEEYEKQLADYVGAAEALRLMCEQYIKVIG